jgi:hypothetical protein
VTAEDMSGALIAPSIIIPNEVPMFSNSDGVNLGKRKREHGKMDPRKTTRPEMPVTGPGKGGRVGASATQHVVQNLVRDTTRDEDVSFVAVPERDPAYFRGFALSVSSRKDCLPMLIFISLIAQGSATQIRRRNEGCRLDIW